MPASGMRTVCFRSTTGFRFETLTDDPEVKKAVDDILLDFAGEDNSRRTCNYGLTETGKQALTKRLPVDAVSFTDEITECDGKLNFYIPINFDPDAVFGTNVASAFNDDWLNVYANFGWKTGRIDSALTVCLVCSDGHEFEFFYPLTSAEQVQLWNQMDAYCHQQNGQSLGETRTALLREQAEEGLEIRL